MNRTKSRRGFLQSCLSAGAGFALAPLAAGKTGPATRSLALNQDWHFEKSVVTLPHCVAPLSWHNWDPGAWEKVWSYRRDFTAPRDFHGLRMFLHFEGALTSATPTLNGHALPRHAGGYLPFQHEITGLVKQGGNQLAVAVDARWQSVPPEGSPKGPRSIDYLEPGGIWGSVRLLAVPDVFIKDVFAKAVRVLDSDRNLEVACMLDAAHVPSGPIRLEALLMDRGNTVARASKNVRIEKPGETSAILHLANLRNVTLWDVERPYLYEVMVTAFVENKPVHEYRVRTGLREARFELDGFFLNGSRVQLLGLNRHELFPYVGRAMPNRAQRRDAEIIRREFHCNMVRCSHYPQSESFLDACDELGLMVWEEPPGWQYLGDAAWKDLVVRDVRDMVRRDRNHPAIIIWGVRVNESHNDPALYTRTKKVAKSLDGTRQTSGSMTRVSTKGWVQDVFAFDDYHAKPDGSVSLAAPIAGVPFFFSEAVGQFNYPARHGFNLKYRRAGDAADQQRQAIYHAQAHDRAAANKRYCGLIAWCAFEYGSLLNGYETVKYPGVADFFRIPKLGASFYLSQGDPKQRPVIEPNFYWDFGSGTPSGPGDHAAIFSNCDRLELHIDGKPHATLHPDRTNFPHLKYPPFFADLSLDGSKKPELRIDGYLGNRLALSRSFSSYPSKDQLSLQADDSKLTGDGSDATRLVFRVVDQFGAPRLHGGGTVSFEVKGPAVIVGDNPFDLGESGGSAAVWVRTLPGRTGRVRITAKHSKLGRKSVEIQVRKV
ncbi:MAG TPA: glycoside hydrolase family 2 TIM barrel-domain containing protein [Bryobacteraceae bacterium]